MNVNVAQYNLIREALAANENEDHEMVEVRPKKFALKMEHSDEVLGAAQQLILDDARITKGITPLHTIEKMKLDTPDISTESILYVLVAYAVAIQQKWIRHSPITNSYWVNQDHKQIAEYVEDTHKVSLN